MLYLLFEQITEIDFAGVPVNVDGVDVQCGESGTAQYVELPNPRYVCVEERSLSYCDKLN